MQRTHSFNVTKNDKILKLVSFLKLAFKERYSAKFLKKAIEAGSCRVNSKIITFASHMLKRGDKVEFCYVEKDEAPVLLPILYEDEYLVIVNKMAGVSVDENLKKLLPSHHKNIQLVHRLDKDTSGVLVLAKDSKTKALLIALFAKREVIKHYLAIVDGLIAKDKGEIDSSLRVKESYQGGKILSASIAEGRSAKTLWLKLAFGLQSTLLLCQPVTGRTHQIRVHLSSFAHPILGDKQYGKKFTSNYFAKRQLLHAYKLVFTHPVSQAEIIVKAALPKDFLKALRDLEFEINLKKII